MANLEEGELEDGELLSSDEDGEGETASSEKVCSFNIISIICMLAVLIMYSHIWVKVTVLFLVTWHLLTVKNVLTSICMNPRSAQYSKLP